MGEKGTAVLRVPVNADVNLDLRQSNSYPVDWRPRFVEAYRRQNIAWVKTLNTGASNIGATAWDGYCSTAVAAAGLEALSSGATVAVKQIAKPKFYA